MRHNTRTVLLRFGGAVVITALAVLLRWLLDSVVGAHFPLATLYGAVAFAVWLGGYRPALVAVVLGYLACDYLFIEPHERVFLLDARNLTGLILYLASCAIIIGFGEALRSRRYRLEVERAKLQESEAARKAAVEQLQIATESMAVTVTRCSRDLKYQWVNKHFSSRFGRPQEDFIGRPIIDVIGNEAFKQLWPHFEQVLAGNRIEYEEEVNYQGLGPRWIHAVYTPTFDAVGKPDGWVAVILDITERRQTEEALRLNQEAFKLVHQIGRIGHWEWNSLTDENKWSPEIQALYGLEPGTFEGTYEAWAKLLHPDDLPKAEEDVRRALETGKYFTEFRVIWPDGSVHWLEARANVFKDGHDKPVRIMGVNMDVTERKQTEEALRQSEQRFARFMNHLPGLAWIKDLQGRYLYANDAAVKAYRCTRDRLYGKTDEEVFSPETAAQFMRNDRKALASEAGVQVIETLEHEDGIIHHSVVSKFPILGAEGRPVLVGGMAIDITDRLKVEEALKEADRRKDEFLATLAHELRNPLAPIRNSIELLQRADGNADLIQQASCIMERQVGQMVRLVDDLLDISRITQGRIQLRRDRVELVAVARSAVEECRPLIEAHSHEVRVTLPADPIYVDADPTRLDQVFANLISNAAKYTEKGGHICLTVERKGSEAVVSVRDTGIGIAAEHLPRLFEMFSQVEPALERSQGGLGIGLSLVRGLVELHGGTVEVQSGGIGMGSEFTVRLPIIEAPVDAPQKPTEGEKAHTGDLIQHRILVVDDNRDTADSLAMMLRLMGHDTHTAHDGLDAVQAAAAFRPDVVLLDIGLPKMNGYEVARQIRQQPWGKGMALIALTGWGQEEDKRRAVEAGFDHHLTKPVEPVALEELLAIIKPALQR